MDELLSLLKDIDLLSASIVTFATVFVAVYRITSSNKNSVIREEIRQSFEITTKGLYSNNQTERIASAILLRRYLNKTNREGKNSISYKAEALNVIASLLKIEKCSEFQKTLADSLSYAYDMKALDLQYANIQNASIKPSLKFLAKDLPLFCRNNEANFKIHMNSADLFMADLSYSTICRVDFTEAVFYGANLHGASFKGCDFTKANFKDAYLKDVSFDEGCVLQGACFKGASGAPKEIIKFIDPDGIYDKNILKTTQTSKILTRTRKRVFISCSGTITPSQSEFLKKLQYDLRRRNVEPIRLERKDYLESGQLSEIQTLISSCDGLIALCFRDIIIKDGIYRKSTNQTTKINDWSLPSPWISLEVGLAFALESKIMILYDDKLHMNGILESGINDARIKKVGIQSTNYDEYDDIIHSWIRSL